MRKFGFLLFVSLFALAPSAQIDSGLTDSAQGRGTSSDCSPSVSVFEAGSRPHIFCLNEYTPDEGYCKDLELVFLSCGMGVRFHCNENGQWSFEGTGYRNKEMFIPINVEVTKDQQGRMLKTAVFVGVDADSMDINILPKFSGDRIIRKDSLNDLEYDLKHKTYVCLDKPEYKVITDRKFTYPMGYMRREPKLSYPELYWFQHGPGIEMPVSASVRERGELMFLYQVLNPPDLEYSDMEDEIRAEARQNRLLNKRWQKEKIEEDQVQRENKKSWMRKKKKEKKDRWLKFKPLR